MVSSYLRMAIKVSNYNSLREEAEMLRARYQRLVHESRQTNEDVARLQVFATEVGTAYGINTRVGEPNDLASSFGEVRLLPSLAETLEQYNRLKTASLGGTARLTSRRWLTNTRPAIWPAVGRLMSSFGSREDPFHGTQAFHTGVDISVPEGTPVRVTADGVVMSADWAGNYGRLIVVDHGNGLQTYYAHLSRIDVLPGQEVRLGQTIGASGASGRVTAPHLHYEIRERGGPKNPWRFLSAASLNPSDAGHDFGF
jgi:murein DD-endopeptidase MepM/ murein hydrolase activator NlpD